MAFRTRVKVCGITRLEDALAAVACGVDAIGFNFCASSSRYIELSAAAAISKELPDNIAKVGLFVDAESYVIDTVLSELNLDLLQFHGGESREFCTAYGVPYIKAIEATESEEIRIKVSKYEDALAILIDTQVLGSFGGTGCVFDWQIIPVLDIPLVLAGGLNPENVADAIRQVEPCAVDVASGVESSRGIKDLELMRQFMGAVEGAHRSK